MKRAYSLNVVGLLCLLVFFCIGPLDAQEDVTFPTEHWLTSTPEAQGMDSTVLAELLNSFEVTTNNLHSLLIIRHGYVVLDTSTYLFDSERPHWQFSVTKSIISTLVGIAIDQGFIESVDQSIWDFFSQEGVANMDERKASITIADLLTQRSGLAADDRHMYTLTADDESWVQYVLDSGMSFDPGTYMQYLDANAHLVSAILQQATGMSTFDFARQNLFAPLGITDAIWMADPQGVYWGGDGLLLCPYDMAKIGYLYLQQGRWGDQQIVSADWVNTATSTLVVSPYTYGYLWWTAIFGTEDQPHTSYLASGYKGQEIWVVPDYELIVVLTGDVQNRGYNLVQNFVLPSITSQSALPENPDALAQLQAETEAVTQPISEVVGHSETAHTVSGQVFSLAENDLGWESISIEFENSEALMSLTFSGQSLELPIGLDNVFRVSSEQASTEPFWLPMGIGFPLRAQAFPLAARGWWNARGDFNVYIIDLSGSQEWVIQMTFRDGLNLLIQPTFTLQSVSVRINGQAE